MKVYQVLIWGQDVRDADFDVTMNYATVPNPVAISPSWAMNVAQDLLNQERIEQGMQLIYLVSPDFAFHVEPGAGGVWTYTDPETGYTVAIHETEVRE